MSLNNHNQFDQWEPCEPGLIQEVALSGVRSRRAMIPYLIGSCFLAIAIGTGLSMVFAGNGTPPPAISCGEFQQNLTSFVQGKIADERFKQQLVDHLNKCKPCRDSYKSLVCPSSKGNVIIKPCPTACRCR